MNLLTDPMYPVQRADGSISRICFREILSDYETNPVVAFAAPRDDLNGALLQLAIALLQTTIAPKNRADWETLFANPLSVEALDKALAPLVPHFELCSDGPAAFQALELLEDAKTNNIDALLLDAPGDTTLKKNIDFFHKRNTITGLCPSCCAAALFCLQTNAPAGGVGYRTSIRGGGPLTTLFLGQNLWQTLMFAVLDGMSEKDLQRRGAAIEEILPWLAPTRWSKKGETVTPGMPGIHPLQAYWAMPRPIRLETPNEETGSCDFCGLTDTPLFRKYRTTNYGNNYTGWIHPLSPYYNDGKDQILPVHLQSGDHSYSDWLGLVVAEPGKKERIPAKVITTALGHRKQELGKCPRFLVFGFDMDNAKASNWIWRAMPIYVDFEHRETYDTLVRLMITAAKQVASNTEKAFKEANFKNPKGGNFSFVKNHFWNLTEPEFLDILRSHCAEPDGAGERWLRFIRSSSVQCFDEMIDVKMWSDICPQQVIQARSTLNKFNHSKDLNNLPWPSASLRSQP